MGIVESTTSKTMRLEVVFLVCCACVIQGKKRGTRDSAENSVLDKSEVMDSLSLSHSSKGVLKKNKPVPKERLTSISLDPMDGKLKMFGINLY